MRGIVGYLGGQSALDVVLAGLQRLARPDDACAGVAVLADGQLAAAKHAGALPGLHEELARRPLPSAGTALAHLRRAGHGGEARTVAGNEAAAGNEADVYPRLDSAGRVAVVQDGTLDRRAALRAELGGRGHACGSGAGTEAVAQLLAEAFSSCGDLAEAVRQVCRRTEGAFRLVAVHADDPDVMVGACRAAPLVAGWGGGDGDGEFVLASDAAVFGEEDAVAGTGVEAGAGVGVLCGVREVVELGREGREQVVELRRAGGMTVTDFEGAATEADA